MIYTVTLNPTIDRTLTVERFCAGGTFKASHSDLLPAGKGINVARVVATLGERVAALGLVGEQDVASFEAALSTAGIEDRLLPVPGATRASVTILDPVCRTETHLREPGLTPPPGALAAIEAELARVRSGDWVVFAGSLPPGMPTDAYGRLIRTCVHRGAHTLLDANGPALLSAVDASPTVLKPNLFELWQIDRDRAEVTAERGLDALPTDEVLVAARRAQERGIAMVVVSLGERGVLGLDRDGRAWRAQVVLDRPVVDAVGSGDALGGGLVVALARGNAFAEALRLGVACGAANTLIAGAGRCSRADIERLAARARVEVVRELIL
jgi:1-phosphofructokinase family hexose kinase